MTKLARLLCALSACGPLALGAGAAESPVQNAASVAAANRGQEAADGNASGADTGIKAGRPVGQESTPMDSAKGAGSKGRNAAVAASPPRHSAPPQSGIAHAARGNADRLHSLQRIARALGPLSRQPSPGGRVGPARAVTHDPHDGRGPQGMSPASPPKLAASNGAARPAARPTSIPRNLGVGGPHAQGVGQVGGPAIARTTHSGTIDGTQVHHKF
jgi:hypothetical protein